MMMPVEFEGPNGVLRGTLHLPEAKGPTPGVLMMHGFTGQRMECTFLFVQLSRALEAAGVASFRFDFFGSGESDGDFIEMTASTERADALAALDFFRRHEAIDADRVGLLGMSFGGFMTACTAGERPDQVRAAVLLSAAGNTLVRWQERMTDDERRALRERGWLDRGGLRQSAQFMDDLEKHRPFDEIAKYPGPVLVAHGTADETVPLSEAEEYVRVLEGRERGDTDHLFVEGANHPWANWDHRQALRERATDWFRKYL